jgi:4-amino-4-deoxy-L-arabinose transferase-like glycosyltransferase
MKLRAQVDWSSPARTAVLITLVGAVLRFYRLDAQSFWGDEAFSAIITAGNLRNVLNNTWSVNPPAYFILLRLWRSVVGKSDFALRFPSAVLGILGIPLSYQLGRNIRSKQMGIWAAITTTVAPFHIFYSQEARMYTQIHSLICIIMLAYVRLWHDKNRRWWIVFALASTAGLLTHFFAGIAIFIIGGHFCSLKLRSELLSWSPPRARDLVSLPSWVDFIATTGAVLMLFGLYLPRFLNQVQMYSSETWHPKPSMARLLGVPLALITSQFLKGSEQTIALGLVLSFVIIIGLQISRALWQRAPSSKWLFLLAMLFLTPPAILFLLAHVWKLVFTDRVLIVSVPAFYLLLAWSATHTRERKINRFILILLFILMLWGLHNWYFNPAFAKPPIRDAVNHIQTSKLASAPVVHGTATSHRLFEHYAVEIENHLLSGSPMAQRAENVLKQRGHQPIHPNAVPSNGFWYVFFPVHSLKFQYTQRDKFDAQFNREYEQSIDGIRLYYYTDRDTSSNE